MGTTCKPNLSWAWEEVCTNIFRPQTPILPWPDVVDVFNFDFGLGMFPDPGTNVLCSRSVPNFLSRL